MELAKVFVEGPAHSGRHAIIYAIKNALAKQYGLVVNISGIEPDCTLDKIPQAVWEHTIISIAREGCELDITLVKKPKDIIEESIQVPLQRVPVTLTLDMISERGVNVQQWYKHVLLPCNPCKNMALHHIKNPATDEHMHIYGISVDENNIYAHCGYSHYGDTDISLGRKDKVVEQLMKDGWKLK